MTPEELKQSSKPENPKFDRRSFLKLAGITIAGVLTGTLFRPKESTEATSPPTVIYWTDSLGRKRDTGFFNASSGISPYNNPDRPVATIYDWINTPDNNFTTPPDLIYQPWEGVYPETQAGPGVFLEIGGLLADRITNKEYMLTFVMSSSEGNISTPSIEIVQDANNPTDYSNNGRVRIKDGLPQTGIHSSGKKIVSCQFGTDPNNKRYLEVGWTNEYVPAENGIFRVNLDNNGNLIPPFIRVTSAEPTPTPTSTATPQPSPTAISRRNFLYLPMLKKDNQEGK